MAENMTLTINTGAMVIDIENEKGRKIGEFEFIPTDSNILSRYDSVVDFLNSVQLHDGLSTEETAKELKQLNDDRA